MKQAKPRRSGATETFSVSVDQTTKRALRRLADEQYAGHLSAAVTGLAEDARRRLSAGAYLRRLGIPALTGAEVVELEASIAREIAATTKSRRRQRVA